MYNDVNSDFPKTAFNMCIRDFESTLIWFKNIILQCFFHYKYFDKTQNHSTVRDFLQWSE